MRWGHLVAQVEHMREATRLKQLLEQGPVIDVSLRHMHALSPQQRLPRTLQRGCIKVVEIVKPSNTCGCHAILTPGPIHTKKSSRSCRVLQRLCPPVSSIHWRCNNQLWLTELHKSSFLRGLSACVIASALRRGEVDSTAASHNMTRYWDEPLAQERVVLVERS